MNAYGEGFWWLLTWACVLWYTVITGYVAIRGIIDIRTMLTRLSEKGAPRDEING